LLGNAFGLQAAPERRVAVMATRAAANQFGYFVGSAVGGIALAAAGYPGLAVVLGLLFVAAAAALSTRQSFQT
jgi:predicted MFS family arabinose efflux permease